MRRHSAREGGEGGGRRSDRERGEGKGRRSGRERGDDEGREHGSRYARRKSSSPVPIIVAVVFGAGALVVLGIVMTGGSKPTPVPVPNQPTTATTASAPVTGGGAAVTTQSFRPPAKDDETAVYYLVNDAKALGDTPQAVKMIEGSLSRYPDYQAELYAQMGYRSTDWNIKLGYYEKALKLAEAGGKFAYGNRGQRLTQLNESLRQAKLRTGRE